MITEIHYVWTILIDIANFNYAPDPTPSTTNNDQNPTLSILQ